MRGYEILLLAIVFSSLHVASPWLFSHRGRARNWMPSFSGGLAAAYVFLHLIPEIDEGGHLLGSRIYVIVLFGLAVYYGIEILILRTSLRSERNNLRAALQLFFAALYVCLLQITLGSQLPDTSVLTGIFAVALGVHLLSMDFGLQEEHGCRYSRTGRFILVAAVLFGYGFSFLREPDEEIVDILTALLAGFMLFKVFRRELPEFRDARYSAFVLGACFLLTCHLLLQPGFGSAT